MKDINKVNRKPMRYRTKDKLMKTTLFTIALCLASTIARAEPVPANLWQGLIAEDTKAMPQVYESIASVVHNRLSKGMSAGLVALKRPNLAKFVDKEQAYALSHGTDLQKQAQQAIEHSWNGNDYANGATHYEHTGVYPTPRWARSMTVVKVLYKGTRNEITFYKGR